MAQARTMVQIRERGFLDLLDLSLVVVRRRPLTLGLAALAGIAPFALLNAWLARLPEVREVYFDALLLPWFEAPLATAPLTVVLGGLMFGERRWAGRVARSLAASFLPMVVFQVVLRGLAFCIYPLIPSRLGFLNEVILLEREPWRKVIGRSATLCGREGVELFFQWMAQVAFGAAFVGCFWMGTSGLYHALIGTELTWDEPGLADLRGPWFQLALWLTIAYFAVVRFLTYIDQRTRHEGWEVSLRLKEEGRKLREAERW